MIKKGRVSELSFAGLLTNVLLITSVSIVCAYPPGPLSQDDDSLSVENSLNDETLVNLAERYLTTFDISLASKIKPFVVQLNEKQKKQFLNDIKELNEAIEDEILTELYGKASGGDDTENLTTLYGGISKNVINRVIAMNQNKPWLSRIMNFAGNEIESSIPQ